MSELIASLTPAQLTALADALLKGGKGKGSIMDYDQMESIVYSEWIKLPENEREIVRKWCGIVWSLNDKHNPKGMKFGGKFLGSSIKREEREYTAPLKDTKPAPAPAPDPAPAPSQIDALTQQVNQLTALVMGMTKNEPAPAPTTKRNNGRKKA